MDNMGMGRVEIFRIELTDRDASGTRLTLAGGRELGGDHFIDFGEFLLPLFPEQASAFAFAVMRLAWRRRQATPKPGVIWRRTVGDGVGPGFRVELGLTDEGRVYIEAAGTKVVCDDARGDVLVAVLERFRDDVNSVAASGPGVGGDMNFGVAQGLRGRWADDTKWR
jgi:hypothetical protein